MRQRSGIQRLALLTLAAIAFLPSSLFAEDRPAERTTPIQAEVYHRGDVRDLEGIVVDVSSDGDDILLRTGNGRVRIDAGGGVRVSYRGERFRVRDLERGDRIAVDLISTRGRRLRARSIEVLMSVSHDRGNRRDRGPDRDRDRGWRDGDRDRTVSGQIASFDARLSQMSLRTRDGRNVIVDTRLLDRRYGRSWARSVRVGDWVEIEGEFDGWNFVAESFDRYNNGRW